VPMVVTKMCTLARRGRTILREEGFTAFMKRAALFLKKSFSVNYSSYYIYENRLEGPQFEPKIEGASLKIVSAPEEFDRLAAEGLILLPWDIKVLKNKAARGAIAFCAFVGRNLAHVTWLALSEEAKNTVDPFPTKIDWQREAWSGSSRTNAKFQRMGLYSYVYSEIFRYLKEIGRVRDRFTIEKNNTASQNTLAKFDSKVIAEGWYLKVFFWKFWKEKPKGKHQNV
jgi:hypothetical protein